MLERIQQTLAGENCMRIVCTHFGTSSSNFTLHLILLWISLTLWMAFNTVNQPVKQSASQPASQAAIRSGRLSQQSTLVVNRYGWMTMVMMMWRHVALTLVECNKAILPPKWINYSHCLIVDKQKRWLYWHGEKRNCVLFLFHSIHKEQMIQYTI